MINLCRTVNYFDYISIKWLYIKFFLFDIEIEDSQYKSAVGAGDSFVAGLATYLESKGGTTDWKDCASFAMATATASCETYLAGGVDVNRVNEIFNSRSR